MDPVVPYVDEQQLSAMTSFYGLAPDCPVPHTLVRAALGSRAQRQPGLSQRPWASGSALLDCWSASACKRHASVRQLQCITTTWPCAGPVQVARSLEARPKKLHYVSPAVRDLLRVDVREQLKIIGAGVKTWERQDDKVRGWSRAAGVCRCVAADSVACLWVAEPGLQRI